MKQASVFIQSLQGINGGISSKRIAMYAILATFITVVMANLFAGKKLDPGLQIQLCSALGVALTFVFFEKKKDGSLPEAANPIPTTTSVLPEVKPE